PDLVETHCKLAAALIKIHQPQKAIEHCQAALQWRPDYVEAYVNLTLADAQLGRSAAAIASAQTAIALARQQGRLALAQELEISLKWYQAQLVGATNHEKIPAAQQ
ncbi:MAG TPA: hypothetical protein VGJ15_03440, partial [Pirellulales bacterium]